MSAVGNNPRANIDYSSTDPARNPYWHHVVRGEYISGISPSQRRAQGYKYPPSQFKEWRYKEANSCWLKLTPRCMDDDNKFTKYYLITLLAIGIIVIVPLLTYRFCQGQIN